MADAQDDMLNQLLARVDRAKRYRANFEYTWDQISRYVIPRIDDFITKSSPGVRKEQHVYDSTAQQALPAFAAAVESLLTPRMAKWHHMRPANPALAADEEVVRYCEGIRDLLFRSRYGGRANFASQASECYVNLGAFGTMGLFVEDALSRGVQYQAIPLSELFIEENAWGFVDTVHRVYTLTARQAFQRWGEALPEKVRDAAKKEPEREYEFIHCVYPNDDLVYDARDYRGMAYVSVDICKTEKQILTKGGFRTMPYIVARYFTAAREVYGRSPAWDALADIKTLNEMSKTGLRYGQLVADPPWITADVDSASPFSMRPGAINAGYMNERGEMLAKSLAPNGDPRFSLEMMDQRRQAVNRAFLVTLFQILVETPEMTATEVVYRAQEKGALLAPTVGRLIAEFLAPLIARELDILSTSGVIEDVLGPPPEALVMAGGRLDIEYDSPLTRMQKSEETAGILRVLETATPLAQIDPTILQSIDTNFTLRALRDGYGAPVGMIRSAEQMAAIEQQNADREAAAALMQAAPIAADTAKTVAETQKISAETLAA